MKFDVLTLFPEMFEPLKHSIINRAVQKDLLEINITNIRDYAQNKHNQVDDTPYGGGNGMVLKPDVVARSIEAVKSENSKIIYMSPKGKLLNQEKVVELSKEKHLVVLCGHYEGIDQRVLDKYVDEEISIGDYVLTGGEIPSMVLIDSISRYVDNVLKEGSTLEESFANGLLEYPQYTRPEVFCGMDVPEVLKNGNHQEIAKWKKYMSIIETKKRRPDLLEKAELSDEERKIIDDLDKK